MGLILAAASENSNLFPALTRVYSAVRVKNAAVVNDLLFVDLLPSDIPFQAAYSPSFLTIGDNNTVTS